MCFGWPLGRARPPAAFPEEVFLSCAMLNRITYYELDILRLRVRSVLNRLGTDAPLCVGGVTAASQQGSAAKGSLRQLL
jgi:hypothetical protein